MKRKMLWMLTAILTFCGANMLTSCSSDDEDTPTAQAEVLKEKLVGQWISERTIDMNKLAGIPQEAELPEADGVWVLIYHFNADGTGWQEYNILEDDQLVNQPYDRYGSEYTYEVAADGTVSIQLTESDLNDELHFDGTVLKLIGEVDEVIFTRASADQIQKYQTLSDEWHGGSAYGTYKADNYKPKGVDNSSWMKQLADNRLVADLSLPGSHDACTGEGWMESILSNIYEMMAKTQDLTVSEQLKIGVRVFDLRPERNLEKGGVYQLRCKHGPADTKLLVKDFFNILKQWLASHPTEFCALTVDLTNTTDKEAWKKEFYALVSSSEYKSMFADFKPRLTVGEMRGKVLMLSKWEYAAKPIGGYCYGWVYDLPLEKQQKGHITGPDGSEAPLWVQDYWGKSSRKGKDEAVVRMLEAAVERDMDAETPVWVINYPSAYFSTPFSDSYRENAIEANKVTIDWLANHTGSVGIIYMDFAGMDKSPSFGGSKLYNTVGMKLVDSVIKQNLK